MIQLDSISKHFGGRTLFEDLSWQLRPGRRIGLVGPNGAGKTTLFKILHGDEGYDAGRLIVPNHAKVGLLPQTVGEMIGGTVWSRMLDARKDLLEQEEALQDLRTELSKTKDPVLIERLTTQLGEAEDLFEREGGYTLHVNAKAILNGMGFADDRFDAPVESLSGGWRMRLVLAQLLLQRPTVLLMDEPTNHLDVPSLEWLESFLQGYDGTVVIISHDRYFLNRLVDEIASLEHGQLFVEQGNFDDYLASRAMRLEQRAHLREQQDKEIEHLESFLRRFGAKATKPRQAQSRVKKLEKLKSERIELQGGKKDISIRFPDAKKSGRTVFKVSDVHKAYGDNVVYDGLNLEIERGERIALVGPNGQGKSTLLKMLAHVEAPDAGAVELGYQVELGYFAQHHIEGLDLNHTILQAMESAATNESFPRCRAILGAFLFSGEAVEKKISVLSGGEKHRVALAQLLLKPTNVLLLDEPTNHLDMESRAVLEDALEDYEGTVIFVSHDRGFINNVATKVIHIADRKADEYYGDYENYAKKRAEEKTAAEARKNAEANDAQSANKPLSKKDERRRAAELRQELNRRVGPLKKKVQTLEQTIETLEEDKEKLEAKLSDVEFYQKGDPEEFAKETRRFQKIKDALEKAYSEWEEASQQIAEVEEELQLD